MTPQQEIIDAIQILIDKALDGSTKIYNGSVTSVGTNRKCTMRINGVTYDNIYYYGGAPTVNSQHRVFLPEGNMSTAFIVVGGGGGGGGTVTIDDVAGLRTILNNYESRITSLESDMGDVGTALNAINKLIGVTA